MEELKSLSADEEQIEIKQEIKEEVDSDTEDIATVQNSETKTSLEV